MAATARRGWGISAARAGEIIRVRAGARAGRAGAADVWVSGQRGGNRTLPAGGGHPPLPLGLLEVQIEALSRRTRSSGRRGAHREGAAPFACAIGRGPVSRRRACVMGVRATRPDQGDRAQEVHEQREQVEAAEDVVLREPSSLSSSGASSADARVRVEMAQRPDGVVRAKASGAQQQMTSVRLADPGVAAAAKPGWSAARDPGPGRRSRSCSGPRSASRCRPRSPRPPGGPAERTASSGHARPAPRCGS